MIALARKTLIHEWRRFVPAVFAVGFSCVLLVVQAALVLGIFGSAALYVRASGADLWAGYPGTQSVNFGRAIGSDVDLRLAMDPAVVATEPYLWVDADWRSAQSGSGGVSIYLSGIRSAPDGMLFSHLLTGWQRAALRAPGAVIVDRADLSTLGTSVGGTAWINAHEVHVVAAVDGLRGLGGANVLSSIDTAREIAGTGSATAPTYVVARTRTPEQAREVRPGSLPEPRASVRSRSGRPASSPAAPSCTGCWTRARAWPCCSWWASSASWARSSPASRSWAWWPDRPVNTPCSTRWA